MTSACESKQYNSSQVAVSVLLIGDNDVVIQTSGLLWETLPRFGEIRVVKLVPLSAVPYVDPNTYQLLFFHLSNSRAPAELQALRTLRKKTCQRSGEAVCVLVVPEAGLEDLPDGTADFVLTQPVTVETLEKVLRRCSFLSEQSQNERSPTGSPNAVVEQKPEPESVDHQAEPGTPVNDSWQCINNSKTERATAGGGASPCELLSEGPSAQPANGDLQALLHSKKEQKRRSQIRECCERLRELLPFIKPRTDTATTLELTVKYMTYVRQRLPQDVMEKVVKALEDNGPDTWFKPTKAAEKRMERLVRNKRRNAPLPEPSSASFADDFIAAHVLGKRIQPKVDGIRPISTVHPSMLIGQPFAPLPDLKSSSAPSVPHGRASVPFPQTYVVSQAFSGPAAMAPTRAPTVFWKQACGPVSPVMVNQNLVPQVIPNPSVSPAVIVGESPLPPVQMLVVGPDFLPPVGLEPGYAPLAQPAMMNQTFAQLGPLKDPCAPEFAPSSQPFTSTVAPGAVFCYQPITTASAWEDEVLSEILYDSVPSLPGTTSYHSDHRVDNLPPSSAPEPSFSYPRSGPNQRDYGRENAPLYPSQPYRAEKLRPLSSSSHFPAQNAPDLGTFNQFLEDSSTTKLYEQPDTEAMDLRIN
ncbi:hypothetical protein GJAV_G00050830 [Gymnothorax javanicus]|nr:hypothetical protein GJAV_G00050830 [Gymnothorax javanicus]